MSKLDAEQSQRSPYVPRRPESTGPFPPRMTSTTAPRPVGAIKFGDPAFEFARYPVKGADKKLSGRALAPGHAPIRATLKLQAYWGVSDAEMFAICGLPADEDQEGVAASLVRYMKLPDVKARLTSLMIIRSRLSAMFGGDDEPERRWLRTPWARLNGVCALDLMRSTDLTGLLTVEAQLRELTGT